METERFNSQHTLNRQNYSSLVNIQLKTPLWTERFQGFENYKGIKKAENQQNNRNFNSQNYISLSPHKIKDGSFQQNLYTRTQMNYSSTKNINGFFKNKIKI